MTGPFPGDVFSNYPFPGDVLALKMRQEGDWSPSGINVVNDPKAVYEINLSIDNTGGAKNPTLDTIWRGDVFTILAISKLEVADNTRLWVMMVLTKNNVIGWTSYLPVSYFDLINRRA